MRVEKDKPYYEELGPVTQALYREAQQAIPEPWEIEEDEEPNVYIDADIEQVRAFLDEIDPPCIHNETEMIDNLQYDLARFPKLKNVVELGDGIDTLIHCYGDFADTVRNLQEEVQRDIDFSHFTKDDLSAMQRDIRDFCNSRGHMQEGKTYGTILFHDMAFTLQFHKEGEEKGSIIGKPRYPTQYTKKDPEFSDYLAMHAEDTKPAIQLADFSPSYGDRHFSYLRLDKGFKEFVADEVTKYLSEELRQGVPQSVRKAISSQKGVMRKQIEAEAGKSKER